MLSLIVLYMDERPFQYEVYVNFNRILNPGSISTVVCISHNCLRQRNVEVLMQKQDLAQLRDICDDVTDC